MTRYLTPSKVSLLVLCTIYCSSVVPTSATVPFLSLIVRSLQITPPSKESTGTITTASHEEAVRQIGLALDKHVSSIPGRSLFDIFLAKIWEIDSLDALHEYFGSLDGLLAKTAAEARRDAENGTAPPSLTIQLSRTSPMGIFVRRCQLEFTRLQFHDAMRLWTAFLQYKQLTAPAWRQRGHSVSAGDFDTNLKEFEMNQALKLLETTYSGFADDLRQQSLHSLDDVERLLQFQVEKLQKYGSRVPPEMMKQVQSMLDATTAAPSLAYFVQFFEAWRAGDYTSAFDHLHRYFDYTMQARDKTYYQYALLHMAILQADFGCFDEAMASMMETIATARENQDMNCLNFSLSWLSHLRKAYPEAKKGSNGSIFGSDKQALAFLKSKAKEGKMWSLLGSVLLGETKLELSQGGNIVRAFEHLYQSAHLSTMHHVASNQGVLLLMNSSVYSRLGLEHLSVSYAQLLLYSEHHGIPTEDKIRAVCRIAFAAAQRGKYDEALDMLSNIAKEASSVLKLHQHVISYMAFVRVKRFLRRLDTAAATHILSSLSDPSVIDPELEHTFHTLSIELLVQNSSYSSALSKADSLLSRLRAQSADIYHITSTQLLKVHILSQCGQSHRGLSLAMRAASVAYRSRLMPLLWDAIGAVAEILNEGEEFKAAQQILQVIIPQAIESGDVALCATLCSREADAWVGMAGAEGAAQRQIEQAKALSFAERSLERALEYYTQVEDTLGLGQTIAKRAMLAMFRGESQAAEALAERYEAERAFQVERLIVQ